MIHVRYGELKLAVSYFLYNLLTLPMVCDSKAVMSAKTAV